MRGRCAGATPSHARSMSLLRGAREPADDRRLVERPALAGRRADLVGDRAHRLEVVGRGGGEARLDDVDAQPRQCRATSSFSAEVIVAPGDCSPSRSVVSKMRTWVLVVVMAWLIRWGRR